MHKRTKRSFGGNLASSLVLFIVMVAGAMPPVTDAADVVLNPGYISGTISVTGETIDSSSITASGSAGNATTGTSSASYTLTVHVPPGESATYLVIANSYLSGGASLYFPSQTVTVNEGQTTTANFTLVPGYIQATINVTSGSLGGFYLSAYDGNNDQGSSSRSFSGSTGSLPVFPSSSVTVYGSAYFTDGGNVSLDSQTVSVGAGETVGVSWTISPPPPPVAEQGTISGNFELNGATADQHTVNVSGPSSGFQVLSGNGPYSLTNLNVGNYGVYANSSFNNYTSYLQYPDASFSPNRYMIVSGGATTNVDISADAAFLNGTLTLTGTKSLSQTGSSSLNAYGIYQTDNNWNQINPAYGGWASTSPNGQTGAYSMVVTPGSWNFGSLALGFYDADPFLNEYLDFYDQQNTDNPVTLAAGDMVTKNLTYGTGSVTVNFLVLGGGTLSYPNLSGSCYKYDQNNQLLQSYYFNSNGNQSNVNPGSVTFVGMAGTCTIVAYATVGGSYTQFGQLTVDVVPGASQVIDIGGPALTVTFPEPEYVTSNASITVTGTTTDDVAVASVTVNGSPATTNPSTPAPSVSFEAIIGLNYGPNQIQTVAADTSGKTASDTRTVYRDEGPPTLNWTPADGSVTSNLNATVTGTANDDAGIATVSVNGQTVSLTPTGNGNEVSFSANLSLAQGDNFIEVVATDISNRNTTQTHKVTVGQQQDATPPTIFPTVTPEPNEAGWNNGDVTVSWNVDDPESGIASSSGCDTITFTTETAGITMTCTATNGSGLSTSASMTIKIDKTAPTITGLPATGACTLWPPNHRLVHVATVTANGGLSGLALLTVTGSSNELDNGLGDGDTASDIMINGGTVQLRAERSGTGTGRVYTLTATASDIAGNEIISTTTCLVPHSQKKKT